MEFIPVDEKPCPACGETKALTEFSWRTRRGGHYESRCKRCRKVDEKSRREPLLGVLAEQAKARRAAAPEKYQAADKARRPPKPKKPRRTPDEVAERRGEYYRANAERIKAQKKARRREDPEGDRRRRAEYFEKNKARLAHQRREYREKNRETIAEKARKARIAAPEKYSEQDRRHRKSNLAQDCAKVSRRRVAKTQAIPGWADAEAMLTLYLKAKELSPVFGVELNVDHVVPLKSPIVCGLHTEHNLQLLEKGDNIRKGNRHWPDMP